MPPTPDLSSGCAPEPISSVVDEPSWLIALVSARSASSGNMGLSISEIREASTAAAEVFSKVKTMWKPGVPDSRVLPGINGEKATAETRTGRVGSL